MDWSSLSCILLHTYYHLLDRPFFWEIWRTDFGYVDNYKKVANS